MIRPRFNARSGRGSILTASAINFRNTVADSLNGPDFTGAPCTTTDADLWYPAKGDNASSKTAKTLCRGGILDGQRVPPCPFRAACLTRALDSDDWVTHTGTWAGYTVRKIRRMRALREALRRAARRDVAA